MDAARKALPALLGGLSSNVSAGGGDALGAALMKDHDGSLLDNTDPLAAVDAADGRKIIGHIFGGQQDRVVETLGATSRASSSVFSKLLPLLAPLVLAWLAKKVGGALTGGGGGGVLASGQSTAAESTSGQASGLGGLLGGLFGGPSGTAAGAGQAIPGSQGTAGESTSGQTGGLGGLGGLLGGLLGGGGAGDAAAGSGSGLGGLLGGLLGREVENGKSSMPDFAGLFDILREGPAAGGSDSDTGTL